MHDDVLRDGESGVHVPTGRRTDEPETPRLLPRRNSPRGMNAAFRTARPAPRIKPGRRAGRPNFLPEDGRGSALSALTVDIAIPVYNEERALPGCIAALHAYLDEKFPFAWTITVVNNASTDDTRAIAENLSETWPRVRMLHLDQKGKGLALRAAWLRSDADIVAYMDVDLSTGLDALLPLVAALASGHSDIAIGSRLAPGARTVRGIKRELFSRGYNRLLSLTHGVRFTDAQCGFKAARAEVIRPLLRRVQDDAWFFDTELLLLAEHNGLRVHEVAVDWVEDTDSRVGVANVAGGNVRGVLRLVRSKMSGAATVSGLPRRPPPVRDHPDAASARREPPRSWRVPPAAAAVGLSAAASLVFNLAARMRCLRVQPGAARR
jgi:hypothetical protein